MVKSHIQIMDELKQYASPKAKLTRMINAKEIIQIKRGLFVENRDVKLSLKSLSSILYGPSYVSFQSALAFYGLIPERVSITTCASYKKNKNKEFHTAVGDFYYYPIPPQVYPYDTTILEEDGQRFLIATPGKAICDMLYKIKNIETEAELLELLIEDWRIDFEQLKLLNINSFRYLIPLYNNVACRLFLNWIEMVNYA